MSRDEPSMGMPAAPIGGSVTGGVSPLARQAWDQLRALRDRALIAVDYDGTLAPIVADPTRAVPEPGALDALRAIASRVALVAVITGRPARTLVDLAGLQALTGARLVVLGAYGTESWDASTGRFQVPAPGPAIRQARERLVRLVGEAPAGTWLEDKGRAVAVHTRRTADPAGVFTLLEPAVREMAHELGLRFEPGRAVLELREAGGDKGDAVRAAVARTQARALLYCGDDLGDMPAFEAATQLREQGLVVLRVAVASPEREWPSGLVDLQVDGPAGVVALLRELAAD